MIHLISATSVPKDRVRLSKWVAVLNKKKLTSIFIGWNREGKQKLHSDSVKQLLSGGGRGKSNLAFYYPLWVLKVFFYCVTKVHSKDKVIAVSFESALPIYVASKFKKFQYIFDNADNFSLLYPLSGGITRILNWLEWKIAESSALHILPGKSRVIRPSSSDVIVSNTPSKSAYQDAVLVSTNLQNNGPKKLDKLPIDEIEFSFLRSLTREKRFKIYVNGRLVADRGLEIVAHMVRKLDPTLFVFVIVGRVDDTSYADFFASQSANVFRMERSSNVMCLAAYFLTNCSIILYDPITAINRKAESNKWWDSIFTNSLFITNSEIESIAYLPEQSKAVTLPYSDKDAFLSYFLEGQCFIDIKKGELQVGDPDVGFWDDNIIKVLKNFLS